MQLPLTGPDPDTHPQADIPACPWLVPIPKEVPDAQDWGCPCFPQLPCSLAGVVGWALDGEVLLCHPRGTPTSPGLQSSANCRSTQCPSNYWTSDTALWCQLLCPFLSQHVVFVHTCFSWVWYICITIFIAHISAYHLSQSYERNYLHFYMLHFMLAGVWKWKTVFCWNHVFYLFYLFYIHTHMNMNILSDFPISIWDILSYFVWSSTVRELWNLSREEIND